MGIVAKPPVCPNCGAEVYDLRGEDYTETGCTLHCLRCDHRWLFDIITRDVLDDEAMRAEDV